MKNEEIVVEDVCASFKKLLLKFYLKAIKAAKEKNIYNNFAGGVACNSALRNKLTELGKRK